MKILYVLSDTTRVGGASKSFLALMRELVRMGVEPTVVLPGHDGLYEDLRDASIPVCEMPVRFATYPLRRTFLEFLLFPFRLFYWSLLNAVSCHRLKKYLRRHPVDIIHSNVSVIDVGWRVAQSLHIPHVYHFREYADLDFNLHYRPSSRAFHQNVKKQGSYTISITRDIARHHGLEQFPDNRQIYNGIFHRCSSVQQPLLGNYFLYAGRIEPAKGLLSLLESYSEYVQKVENPLPLQVAGNVSDESYHRLVVDFISRHRLSSLVRFLGMVTDMTEIYRQARALIIPSEYEGFGRCMPEAMCQLTMVIGRDTGGTHEQMKNGEVFSGQPIALSFSTADELQSALLKIHHISLEEYSAYCSRAFATVNALYSIEANAEQTYSFYCNILNKQ